MGSPKILHLVWTFNPAGAERIAQVILERCVKEGWEAHACALAPSEPEAKEEWSSKGIVLHEALKRNGFDVTLPFRLKRILSRERISLLHTHNAVSGMYGGWALAGGIRHVHTEHSNIPTDRYLVQLVRARQLRRSSLVAVSQKVAATLSRGGGISGSRIRLIYNGVRVAQSGENTGKNAFRDMGIPPEAVVIGTVGNLRLVKDHRTLVAAFAPIAREDARPHLLIVGEGGERKGLEGAIRRSGLTGRVSLPGFRRDVTELMDSLDVFVLSSRSEGLPVSLLEAMSTGCPCISTAVGGVPEVIQNGENGLLVPAETPSALTRAIRLLLSSPSDAKKLGTRGRETVLERFDETRMLDEYIDLYRGIL